MVLLQCLYLWHLLQFNISYRQRQFHKLHVYLLNQLKFMPSFRYILVDGVVQHRRFERSVASWITWCYGKEFTQGVISFCCWHWWWYANYDLLYLWKVQTLHFIDINPFTPTYFCFFSHWHMSCLVKTLFLWTVIHHVMPAGAKSKTRVVVKR